MSHSAASVNQNVTLSSFSQSECYTQQLRPIRTSQSATSANQNITLSSFSQSERHTQQLQSIRMSHSAASANQKATNNVVCEKPRGCRVCLISSTEATEQKTTGIQTKPWQYSVIANVHWWWEISAAYKWVKLSARFRHRSQCIPPDNMVQHGSQT